MDINLLSQPPRNGDGEVEPHDHPEILDSDRLIRRISKEHLTNDGNGGFRISSMAIEGSSENGGMSVDIEKLILQDNKNPVDVVTTPRWTGSILLKVQGLRALDLKVGYNPITSPPENPYHGEVWGNFTKSKKKQILRSAVWLVPIENAQII